MPARVSRCCSPPESWSVRWPRPYGNPTTASDVSTSGQIREAGTARFSGPNATSSPARAITSWVSGSCRTSPVRSRVLRGSSPSTVSRPSASLSGTGPAGRPAPAAACFFPRRTLQQQDSFTRFDDEVEPADGVPAPAGVPPAPPASVDPAAGQTRSRSRPDGSASRTPVVAIRRTSSHQAETGDQHRAGGQDDGIHRQPACGPGPVVEVPVQPERGDARCRS